MLGFQSPARGEVKPGPFLRVYCMLVRFSATYPHDETPISQVDARVRIILFLAYAVALFLVDTWLGLGVAAVAFVAAFVAARVRASCVFLLAAPVYALVGFMLVSSSLVLAIGSGLGQGNLVPLTASIAFSPDGFAHGCFFAVRVILLVWVSLVLAFTMDAVALADALRWFMPPLAKLGIAVDDIAMMVSVAVRFIPVMAEEFSRVRAAQWSRGGVSEEGGVRSALKGWIAVLVPMTAGLFRRADALGVAMDARCYGASPKRSSLREAKLSAASVLLLIAGLAFCLALAALL